MTQIEYDHAHKCIVVSPVEPPHDEDFELWSTLFLHSDEITINEYSGGADRHQLRFSYQQHTFNLNFEHYSESIWINGEGLEAEHLLAALAFYLS
ncbi:hypothetical protein PC2016_2697 [Pseudoalteromonas carrageenovora]|uniref:Aminopeptidase n=1 Tax=Pseudoalteromonas carrageenovora IAM 12662 TaxID=1314868 RepID=A0A2K4XCF5_PSEVC|nr:MULTISPECIES: DUF3630 family protein [Pseudoalteromonas]KTF11285.1 hypothetical protein ATS74_09900 [Pseudoalteromonas sp. H103]MBE0380866.1 hypothetical protein [Pseudoalteromonas carrageenovora IAM 12662]MCQ8889465.1 DUF3630 family protein [Pseudoalteromonas carrageenovora]MDO6548024.1 DUF3630 family protein [Pseudoalteromonas carrageenovora]MDO6637093.1 DUF3630 family protein [Pseudoalteromonas carrageenovora]